MMKSRMLAAVFAVSVVVATTASAALNGYGGTGFGDPPLPLNNVWQTWSFQGPGSAGDPQPWTFTSGVPVILEVTDAFLSGDQFNVYDNLVSLGMTSVPTTKGDSIGGNYDAAFADPRWSSGQWILPGGAHSITFQTVLSPFESGGAALRARSTAVPEPNAMAVWLLLMVTGGVVYRCRRRHG